MADLISERIVRRLLSAVALLGLVLGLLAWLAGYERLAAWTWAAGTVPVIIGLSLSIVRDLLAGRLGVDAVAFVSMTAALLLGETLAGAVVAVMYAGGNLLEDFAVTRAERDMKLLVDRVPRVAHRSRGASVADVPLGDVEIGDVILVRAGEVIPVDGVIIP